MDDAVPLILLALTTFATPWVLGIVALVQLVRARRRIGALEARASSLEQGLAALRPGAPAAAQVATTAPPDLEPFPTVPPPAAAAHAASLAGASGATASPAGALPSSTAAATAILTTPQTATPTAAPAATATAAPAATTTPAEPPSATTRPAIAGPSSLEEKIALVWFTRIGAFAVLAGAAYFFKYAVDNDWIGPTGRVALGALAGLAAIAAGEALRPRTRALWVNAVQGAGIALLYLAAFAGAALYRLFPLPAAFAAVAVVALAGGALAVRGRSELVLALALAGGLLAPAILSTGEDRPGALLGWLLALCVPAIVVSARLRFLVVPWLAFAGTAAFFGAWYDRFFADWPPPNVLDPNLPAAAQAGPYHALAPRLVPLALALAHVAAWLFTWESFVRVPAQPHAGRRAAPRLWADLWLAAALVAGELGAFSLLHDRALGAGAAVAGAGILAALFTGRAGRPAILLAVSALGGALVAVGITDARSGTSPAWIAAAGCWGAVHLGAAARALLRTRETGAAPPASLLVCAALAGLGFAALVLEATGDGDGLLRAVLAGAAGAAELALGAAVLRRGRLRATILLGTSLALVAAAAAFLLSGASVTLAWAALAAVVAALAARDRDPAWLAGAGLLFAAAVVRLVTVDVPAPDLARSLFLRTDGTQGALHPTFLLNARALALAGTAAALLLAARSVARAGSRWKLAAAALATAAHGCLLTLLVTEAQGLALSIPAPPPAGDALAFEHFRRTFGVEVWAQAGKLDMVATLILGLCAALLVGVGFLAREVFHRWLGLALFAATLGKLLLHDVWRLARLYQVLVFLAVGALMLAAAFLYARYGRRILGMLKEAPSRGPGAALLLAAAGLGIALPARALDPAQYRTVRTLTGVSATGHHAVRVDADLWRASLASSFTLADLRIAGPGGEEVPWTLRPVGGPDGEEEVPATLVDPVVLSTGAVRAVVDKGRRGLRTDELGLELSGDDFLRPVRIESSDDGRTFGVLAEGGRVYAVKGLAGARRTVVRHPASEARFLRVTILPGAGDPPRILGARPVRRSEAPPPMDGLDLGAPVRTAGPDGRTSLYGADLVGAGIPASAVVLSVATPAFERPVRVLGSSDGATYVPLGAGLVWRAGSDEELRIAIAPAGRRWLRIEVRDGDAPPLAVTGVRVEWRAQELVLAADAAGPHTIYVGDPGARRPDYDLGAVLARLPAGTPAAPAALGPVGPNPRYAPRAPELPFTERHRVPLAAGAVVALAGLALWAIRLLRRVTRPS
jgi:uncharacterized membrane protein